MGRAVRRVLSCILVTLLAAPAGLWAQSAESAPVIKQEELDQLLAPIALYPDSLVTQILMASTYPLDVVNAARFAKQNANLKGDPLTKALEAQSWDPSVKSLVNFPQVLTMMNEKLDWTQKLGDAFLAQEKPVMDTIQSLRAKAQAAGNLKTTKEQKVVVQDKIIVIEPASPQIVYVPTYNPTVVYGAWPYPAYPPYYYYPPGYVATSSAFWFASGIALGSAWGYAWGSPNWHGGSVKYNYNQNITINNNINRNVYANQQPANGNWQHNAANRKGVPYSNQAVQQRYNQASPSQQVQARQAYRGYTGSALTPAEQQNAQQRAQQAQQQNNGQAQQARQQQTGQQQTQQQQKSQQTQQARTAEAAGNRGSAGQTGSAGDRSGFSSTGGAFEGVDRGGSSAKSASQRGSSSRSNSGGGAARSGGGGSGAGARRR